LVQLFQALHVQFLSLIYWYKRRRAFQVVGFANPTKDLRVRYFQKLCADMDSASIDACADAGEGFSFAQLQESYILAGQFAFDEQRSITPEDILSAINTLRKALQGADWKGEGASGSKVERR
jgi:hypothetical protein